MSEGFYKKEYFKSNRTVHKLWDLNAKTIAQLEKAERIVRLIISSKINGYPFTTNAHGQAYIEARQYFQDKEQEHEG